MNTKVNVTGQEYTHHSSTSNFHEYIISVQTCPVRLWAVDNREDNYLSNHKLDSIKRRAA